MQSADLSNFFMKYILWVPPSHWLLAIRIFMLGLLSIIATREFYEYTTNKKCKRMGPYVFAFHLVLALEYMIIFKFKADNFVTPFPNAVVISWSIAGIVLFTIWSVLLYREVKKKITKEDEKEYDKI